jgi:hypothetical protein
MKILSKLFILVFAFTLLQGIIYAQVTITNTDISGAYVNSTYVHDHDTLSGVYDFGNASDGQSWNFGFITYHPATTERDTQNFYSPSGHIGTAGYPDANLCQIFYQSVDAGGYLMSMEIANYIDVASNGVRKLGTALQLHVFPAPPEGFPFPEDTLVIAYDHPSGILLPLPLTGHGSPVTSVDTIDEYSRGTSITTKTYTPAGTGTVTLPGGRTQQAVRLLEHTVIVTTPLNGSPTTDDETYVYYWCKDGSQLYFHVPDGYTTGSAAPISYETMTKFGTLGVKQTSNVIPEAFQLKQNYPNPFNPATTITFDVPADQYVTIKVYNMLGQEVETLVNQRFSPGTYQTRFDGGNLPSGVYLYRLMAGSAAITKTMLLIK